MKVTFVDSDTLEKAITDKIVISGQRFLVEEFKPKPRVIKCHRCQAFGHVSRFCRSKKPKCGKCGSDAHESKDCTSSSSICVHCDSKDHPTGHSSCKVIQQKMDEIRQRLNYE